MNQIELQNETFRRACGSVWSIFDESNWLRFMIDMHERSLKIFRERLAEYNDLCERFERYLRTGE